MQTQTAHTAMPSCMTIAHDASKGNGLRSSVA